MQNVIKQQGKVPTWRYKKSLKLLRKKEVHGDELVAKIKKVQDRA